MQPPKPLHHQSNSIEPLAIPSPLTVDTASWNSSCDMSFSFTALFGTPAETSTCPRPKTRPPIDLQHLPNDILFSVFDELSLNDLEALARTTNTIRKLALSAISHQTIEIEIKLSLAVVTNSLPNEIERQIERVFGKGVNRSQRNRIRCLSFKITTCGETEQQDWIRFSSTSGPGSIPESVYKNLPNLKMVRIDCRERTHERKSDNTLLKSLAAPLRSLSRRNAEIPTQAPEAGALSCLLDALVKEVPSQVHVTLLTSPWGADSVEVQRIRGLSTRKFDMKGFFPRVFARSPYVPTLYAECEEGEEIISSHYEELRIIYKPPRKQWKKAIRFRDTFSSGAVQSPHFRADLEHFSLDLFEPSFLQLRVRCTEPTLTTLHLEGVKVFDKRHPFMFRGSTYEEFVTKGDGRRVKLVESLLGITLILNVLVLKDCVIGTVEFSATKLEDIYSPTKWLPLLEMSIQFRWYVLHHCKLEGLADDSSPTQPINRDTLADFSQTMLRSKHDESKVTAPLELGLNGDGLDNIQDDSRDWFYTSGGVDYMHAIRLMHPDPSWSRRIRSSGA